MTNGLKQLICETAEEKFFDNNYDHDPIIPGNYLTCAGNIFVMSNITQGTGLSQRIGNQVCIKTLEVVWRLNYPYYLTSQVATNLRMIIFIWKNDTLPAVANVIVQNPPAPWPRITNYQGLYDWFNKDRVEILYDELLYGYTATGADDFITTAARPLDQKYKFIDGINNIIYFDRNLVLRAVNHIYMIVINDIEDDAIGNLTGWLVNVKWRLTYIDM